MNQRGSLCFCLCFKVWPGACGLAAAVKWWTSNVTKHNNNEELRCKIYCSVFHVQRLETRISRACVVTQWLSGLFALIINVDQQQDLNVFLQCYFSESTPPNTCPADGESCQGTLLLAQTNSEAGESIKERACDTLLMCIVTTLNQGLRNGGGIGDVLRRPSLKENMFVGRVIYDLLFFFVVIIIVLNLIFGVIIDTFADLRSEKQNKEEILKNTCFICGR